MNTEMDETNYKNRSCSDYTLITDYFETADVAAGTNRDEIENIYPDFDNSKFEDISNGVCSTVLKGSCSNGYIGCLVVSNYFNKPGGVTCEDYMYNSDSFRAFRNLLSSKELRINDGLVFDYNKSAFSDKDRVRIIWWTDDEKAILFGCPNAGSTCTRLYFKSLNEKAGILGITPLTVADAFITRRDLHPRGNLSRPRRDARKQRMERTVLAGRQNISISVLLSVTGESRRTDPHQDHHKFTQPLKVRILQQCYKCHERWHIAEDCTHVEVVHKSNIPLPLDLDLHGKRPGVDTDCADTKKKTNYVNYPKKGKENGIETRRSYQSSGISPYSTVIGQRSYESVVCQVGWHNYYTHRLSTNKPTSSRKSSKQFQRPKYLPESADWCVLRNSREGITPITQPLINQEKVDIFPQEPVSVFPEPLPAFPESPFHPSKTSAFKCDACGSDTHERHQCFFKSEYCQNCHVQGHIALVCRSHEVEPIPHTPRNRDYYRPKFDPFGPPIKHHNNHKSLPPFKSPPNISRNNSRNNHQHDYRIPFHLPSDVEHNYELPTWNGLAEGFPEALPVTMRAKSINVADLLRRPRMDNIDHDLCLNPPMQSPYMGETDDIIPSNARSPYMEIRSPYLDETEDLISSEKRSSYRDAMSPYMESNPDNSIPPYIESNPDNSIYSNLRPYVQNRSPYLEVEGNDYRKLPKKLRITWDDHFELDNNALPSLYLEDAPYCDGIQSPYLNEANYDVIPSNLQSSSPEIEPDYLTSRLSRICSPEVQSISLEVAEPDLVVDYNQIPSHLRVTWDDLVEWSPWLEVQEG